MKIFKYSTGPLQVNTYLVCDEETKKGFIVDPGGYEPAVTQKIKEDQIQVEHIILTHGHSDHMGGVLGFKEDFPWIKVVAYKDERATLTDPVYNQSKMVFGREFTLDADIFVEDKEQLQIGNMILDFIHTPGHTKGGMCIYTDGILFTGDTLFCRSIGRTDFPGGNFNELINSVRGRLYDFPDDTAVLSGHTRPTTIGEEKRGNPFV